MKVLIKRFCISMLLGCSMATASAQSPNALRVMTYNIKYDARQDTINGWAQRREEVAGLLAYHRPVLFGLQEGEMHQLDYLREQLPSYAYFGIGRDGGIGKGEYTAVFYDKSVFDLLDHDTFWLSATPDRMSMGWDAAFPRVCTWGRLLHKSSGKTILYLNTHFDHRGVTARLESARLIQQKVEKLSRPGDDVIILNGDFNCTPEETPYRVLTEYFKDTHFLSLKPHYGPEATFNAFDFCEKPDRRIDYIFVKGNVKIEDHATLTDAKDLKYPSDHFPVMATFYLTE